jgi:hypothetical protein
MEGYDEEREGAAPKPNKHDNDDTDPGETPPFTPEGGVPPEQWGVPGGVPPTVGGENWEAGRGNGSG